ncbi:hypothetical protein HMPREF9123_1512 [Neisseria bacilliformis ATCC BAA-1200]|uniref:Uncharacterized protein n=1 Tax=Neisseria bacilliformis ATCC BAA-1200 TaxID=888742 RepID=F2BCM4_9NEIS|nr:hypothetical protein HMPREF9123_1512 [Neisseria bacilliformis ATCC BAA-1200]
MPDRQTAENLRNVGHKYPTYLFSDGLNTLRGRKRVRRIGATPYLITEAV